MPKIFISWSGKASHEAAEALHMWLPVMLQSVKPFISSEDLRKGGRWNSDLASELEQTKFGIICVTPDNIAAPWLLFEAGALSKRVEESHVAPLLLNVKPSELSRPLTQFNATNFDKEDFRKLLKSINHASADEAVKDDLLNRSFEASWPSLEAALKQAISNTESKPTQQDQNINSEKTANILEEILVLVRNQSQILGSPQSLFPADMLREIASDTSRKSGFLNGKHPSWRHLFHTMRSLEFSIDLVKDDTDRMALEKAIQEAYKPLVYILRRIGYEDNNIDQMLKRNQPTRYARVNIDPAASSINEIIERDDSE